MGNSAFRKLAVIEEEPLSNYSNTIGAVDAHHWLHKYIHSTVRHRSEDLYTTENGEELANLIGIFQGLPTLLTEDITPIFVFDGEPHDRKEDEIRERRAVKEKAAQKLEVAKSEDNTEAMRRYKAKTQSLTPIVHETTRELLDILGIPYLEGSGAGEAHAAKLVEEGVADAVFSGDYDALLFGSPHTVREYTGRGPAETINLNTLFAENGLTHEQLVDVALLCGTDYNEGVRGIGPVRGSKYIKSGDDIEDILDQKDATINGLDELRTVFLNPATGPIPSETPTRSQPDFEQAKEYALEWDIPEQFIETNLKKFPRY